MLASALVGRSCRLLALAADGDPAGRVLRHPERKLRSRGVQNAGSQAVTAALRGPIKNPRTRQELLASGSARARPPRGAAPQDRGSERSYEETAGTARPAPPPAAAPPRPTPFAWQGAVASTGSSSPAPALAAAPPRPTPFAWQGAVASAGSSRAVRSRRIGIEV
jgi:hypothetical protein